MRRRRLTHAVLSALLLLAGWGAAGTLPATAADTGPAAVPAEPRQPASDGLVTAMRRDLGLTREQAEARIAAERTAATLAPKARRTAGGAYAGSWFDAATGRLTVALTPDAAPAARRAIEASGAAVRTAAHSARLLDTVKGHCGTVLATNETVNYSQGAVYQLTKTSVCAEPGDSGGSFLTGDQAQGVTSGGWGNCSSGGETWFQPVNEILSRYGLTLHTYTG
ncbi:S1 family peptidase [Streptomyces sp. NPDC006658]|uniref:S1 family peptidase n=1 Tax=Streptomyces sp. NPDC006658 TaxID=3156900 RepID=UPI0033CAAFA8